MYMSNRELKETYGESFWVARFEWDYKTRRPNAVQKPINTTSI